MAISRERVLAVLNHEQPAWAPIDVGGHPARPAWLCENAYSLYAEVKSYHGNRRENTTPDN